MCDRSTLDLTRVGSWTLAWDGFVVNEAPAAVLPPSCGAHIGRSLLTRGCSDILEDDKTKFYT